MHSSCKALPKHGVTQYQKSQLKNELASRSFWNLPVTFSAAAAAAVAAPVPAAAAMPPC